MTKATMYGVTVLGMMPSTAAVTDDAKNWTFILKYDDECDDRPKTRAAINTPRTDIAPYSSTYT